MLADPDCGVVLSLAGSTSAAGACQVYVDMLATQHDRRRSARPRDVVNELLEALGFAHYRGSSDGDDAPCAELDVSRYIYDTYIDEHELQICDATIKEIADGLTPRDLPSRGFIREMGRWLADCNRRRRPRSIPTAYENDVPDLLPGLLRLQRRVSAGDAPARAPRRPRLDRLGGDFRELTQMKIPTETPGC